MEQDSTKTEANGTALFAGEAAWFRIRSNQVTRARESAGL